MSRSSIPQALREVHIDHIVPRCRGGPTTLDNLALQCPNCSLRKADKTTAIDPQTSQSTALFHPLSQTWAEHFRLVADAMCVGITPAGRATVEALGMNALIPRFARACQLALGLLDAS